MAMIMRRCWLWIVNLLFMLLPTISWAQNTVSADVTSPEEVKWGYMAAAIAVGASSLGAGVAVAVVGSAAMGAISEKPEVAGRALIFLGLAEGIAIYGLIVAIMILGKL